MGNYLRKSLCRRPWGGSAHLGYSQFGENGRHALSCEIRKLKTGKAKFPDQLHDTIIFEGMHFKSIHMNR